MLAPLLVQQNYIPALLASHDKESNKVERMSYAADAISDADLVDAVRGRFIFINLFNYIYTVFILYFKYTFRQRERLL